MAVIATLLGLGLAAAAGSSAAHLSTQEVTVAAGQVILDGMDYQHANGISDEQFAVCVNGINAHMDRHPEDDLRRVYGLPRAQALALIARHKALLLACLERSRRPD